jgi:hypothetical protein
MSEIKSAVRKVRSFKDLIYWYLAPSTAKVKTRISDGESAFSNSAAYIMRRIWWAYADPKYQVAFIIPTNDLILSFFSKSAPMRDVPEEIKKSLVDIIDHMGTRGEDWEIIDFGDPFFHALVTTSDDWLVMARLSGSNMNIIRTLFNNYIEYKPGSEIAKSRKSRK